MHNILANIYSLKACDMAKEQNPNQLKQTLQP